MSSVLVFGLNNMMMIMLLNLHIWIHTFACVAYSILYVDLVSAGSILYVNTVPANSFLYFDTVPANSILYVYTVSANVFIC